MKPREIIPRAVAYRDVDEAVTHYLENASGTVALGFIDALETAYDHIRRYPATGSLRYAHELDLPGLRSWSLSRYPYISMLNSPITSMSGECFMGSVIFPHGCMNRAADQPAN